MMKNEKPIGSHYSAQERALRQLQERIGRGLYSPGSLLPTERHLAAELGISRPVIRAALEQLADERWITREPRRRPRIAHDVPSTTGSISGAGADSREFSAGTGLRGLAAIMPLNPIFPAAYDIVGGIQRALARQESSLRVVLFDTRTIEASPTLPYPALPDHERERLALESLLGGEPIDGAILWHMGGEKTRPLIDSVRARGVPIVFVDRYPAGAECDFVGVDNRTGARDAVNYLIGLGHRRIAHVTMARDSFEGTTVAVRERCEGFREALVENGLMPTPDLIFYNANTAVEQIRAALDRADPDAPTAFFAVNDAWAHALVKMLNDEGIRVPEDVSVVGFDDLDRYSHRTPVLTTTYLPFETVGERAAELLLSRIREERQRDVPVRHVLLSTSLIVRSTAKPPTKGGWRETRSGNESAVPAGAPIGMRRH